MSPKILGWVALLPMFFLLAAAVLEDVKRHRIPNYIVFWGAGLGMLSNIALPQGSGFLGALPGGLGFLGGLEGVAVGMGVLLPMYWLRAMGAGDVKLMAMVGAFLGVNDVLGAVLGTFLAGGFFALAFAWKTGVLSRMLKNIRLISYTGAVKLASGKLPSLDDAPETAGKFPYAVAIAVGTAGYVALKIC